MFESASALLAPWASFYVMIGSSAAALTGLMFVVVTLVSGRSVGRNPDGISTFSTPTVLHFAAALLVSAVLVAPWHAILFAGITVALTGLYGLVHILRVALLTRRLVTYRADLEDWAWYAVLPFVAYATIFAAALVIETTAMPKALFAIAGAVLLLIFIGIRNSWDVVTFLTISGPPEKPS